MPVYLVVCALRVSGIDQVQRELVPVEVEVGPALGAPSKCATERLLVERDCRLKVEHWDGEVKRGCHGGNAIVPRYSVNGRTRGANSRCLQRFRNCDQLTPYGFGLVAYELYAEASGFHVSHLDAGFKRALRERQLERQGVPDPDNLISEQ